MGVLIKKVLYRDNVGDTYILHRTDLSDHISVLDDLISDTAAEDFFMHNVLVEAWEKIMEKLAERVEHE